MFNTDHFGGTFRWNNIIGVDSLKEADQLIPFFVAISNCYVLWNEWGKPLAREEYKVQQVPESDAEAEPFQMKDMYQPEGSHIP